MANGTKENIKRLRQLTVAERAQFTTGDFVVPILDALPDALIVVDTDGMIWFFNSRAEALFGYHRDDILGACVDSLVPDVVRPQHPDYRHSYAAKLEVRPMDTGRVLHGRTKSGKEIPVEIMLGPVHTTQGVLVLAVVREAYAG